MMAMIFQAHRLRLTAIAGCAAIAATVLNGLFLTRWIATSWSAGQSIPDGALVMVALIAFPIAIVMQAAISTCWSSVINGQRSALVICSQALLVMLSTITSSAALIGWNTEIGFLDFFVAVAIAAMLQVIPASVKFLELPTSRTAEVISLQSELNAAHDVSELVASINTINSTIRQQKLQMGVDRLSDR